MPFPAVDAVTELPSDDAATEILTEENSTGPLETDEAAADTEPADTGHDEEPLSRTSTSVSSTIAVQGQEKVILRAAVSAPDGSFGLSVNGGVVTFVVLGDAGVDIGVAVFGFVSEGSATAEFAVSELPVGSYTIRATYDPGVGGALFMASSAVPGTLVVRAADATLARGSLVSPASGKISEPAAP